MARKRKPIAAAERPERRKPGPKPTKEEWEKFQMVIATRHLATLRRISAASQPEDGSSRAVLNNSSIVRGLLNLVTPRVETALHRATSEEEVTAIVREMIQRGSKG